MINASPTPASVLDVLRTVPAPEGGTNPVRDGLVRGLSVEPGRVAFTLVAERPGTDLEATVRACRVALHDAFGADLVVKVEEDSAPIGLGEAVLSGGNKKQAGLPEGVRYAVAVASGKGGVGKSTVAANLAVALAREGYRVGLADMDIYGPSVPTMFGVRGQRPRVDERRKILPLEAHGVRLLSMGMLVDDARAVVWRGPMASSAVRQFLGEAEWGLLDVLVLDLPPGTGDVHLTVVQTIPVTGALVVSTPQEVALVDARKGVAMFEQVDVPVLGFVENMAYFTPPDLPDRKYYLFGRGGVARLAERLGVPLLGEIPIEQSVREGGDDGVPVVVAEPDSLSAQAFREVARATMRAVELRAATQPPTQAIEILYR
ncbi:MAG TPA: Mrp/NBP35 family ATP-binding protein [Rhodothermales bacterium]|nr:Mrp/NBP35 family ATP-binding protein [Rhodothermales bacterium]